MGAVTYDGFKYHSVGVGMDLLWENENPATSFSAQTVTLDLLNYEAVMVRARYKASNANEASTICFKDRLTDVLVVRRGTVTTREVTVTGTGVAFTTGYSGGTAGSGNCIPVAIYGLSGIC